MNKIYKVVWSKAKHCYVVTSELAKRQTKGCGARSLRMAAVSLGVAAALIGGVSTPVAEAAPIAARTQETVTVVKIDCSKAYTFQSANNPLAVDAALIATVPNGNRVYGNVAKGKEKNIDVVTYTVIDEVLVKDIKRSIEYGDEYVSVLTVNPFNDTTATGNPTYPTLGEYVKASAAAQEDVSGYSVTMTSGNLVDVAGALSSGGNVSGNSVTMNGGEANTAFGGTTSTGNATNNTVTIGSGSTAVNVYGGHASGYPASGNASTNHVNVNGGTVTYNLWGGYSVAGNANSNEVTVSSGSVGDSLYGGYSDNGNANKNIVSITGGTLATNAYAGVYGGTAYNGTANENEVTISGTANIANIVFGGSSGTEANNNTVTISGGTINSADSFGAVVGGSSTGGGTEQTENGNRVIINGTANVTGDVIGGADGYYTAIASENTVTIDGNAVVTGKVKGASGRSRDKTNNKVYINKGSVTGNVYGAYLDDSGNYFNSDDPNSVWYDGGNTNSNEVHISDGTVSGKAIGGLVGSNVTGNATGNSVAVSGGTVTGDVDGGYTGNGGNVTGNSVTIEGGTVSTVTGGASFGESGNSGDAVSNSVSLSAGSVGSIYGGYSEGKSYNGGAVTGNTVTITGGSVGTNARGGGSFSNTALSGNATNNTVTVSEETGTTTIGGFIVGGITMTSGQSGTAGNANENTVTIRGGTIGGYVMGGDVYSESGTGGVANKNKVTITAGTVSGNVSGGVGISGATGNTVTISGSSQINDTIYGGYTEGGKANDNVITVSDTAKAMNGIQAGYSRNNDAENNTVTVNNGTVGGYIFGGVATGNAKNNRIIVNDGTVSYLEGGSAAESATGNTIEVNGGTVNDTICGGNSNAGTVSGNTVTISGGTVNSGIIGGYTNDGTANDNTVNLKGTADLSNASLSGSNKTDSTGNELHVGGVKGGTDSKDTIFASGTDNKVRRVENFDTVALHSVNWSTSVAALEATTMTNIGTLDIKNLKFYEGGSEKTVFENDEEMALLKNTNSDLSTVTLTYNGGTGVAITTEGVVISGSTEEQTEETGVGGVKLTTQGGNETVKLSADSKAINYTKVTGSVKGITFGEATFTKNGVARDLNGLTFAATNTVDAAGLTFATANGAIAVNDGMTLAANATGVTTEVANNTEKTVAINYTDAQGIAYGATASGTVTSDGTAVSYTVDAVTLSSVDLANWNGTTAGVPDSWSAQVNSVAVNNADAITVVPTATQPILIAGSSMFADVNVAKEVAFDPVTQNGVTLTGTRMNTIKTTQTNVANDTITYELGAKNVQTVDIGEVAWGGAALDGSSADYNYGAAAIGTGNFGFTNPEQVEADTPMTLLQANETLTAIVNEEKAKAYSYTPVAGVTVDGNITGQMSRSGNNVVFTATENRATQLTFRDVEWKDTLMTRPANITFAGANVDTSAINFTNINELAAESRMTLVSDFGNTVGTITGNRYTLGSGLQGEGAASLSGNDLIFTANTAAESLTPTEATHETVMAMDAGTAVLSTGREYVDSAIEGLGLVTNIAPDGTATFASMGGGANRYKTGSHVDTHSWNAIVAVGSKREHKKGDLEWGVFAEYGRGNYTLHDDNGGRGDGDTHYAGGGLLAKWTNKHNVYTEASIRLGRMSDSAKNMLTDNLGNSYGYNVHANYFGGHIGVGKIFKVKGNHDLDVYGKFFYTRRNGVNFDAGVNHYDLDSVASSLLRVGARYGSNDKKWNWYGGLAYEYEFDGESTGTVSTGAVSAAIRSASIKGSSVRGELGVRMEATKTNPWKADIGIYAYGGRHRGFGGTVTVMYMF